MVSNDSLFHLFTNFSPLPYGPKIARLNKKHISTCKSSLSEENLIPRSRNTLGNILLEPMPEYPVCFTMLTNNKGPHQDLSDFLYSGSTYENQ